MRAKPILIGSALVLAAGVSFGFAHTGPAKTRVNGTDWYASFEDAKKQAKKTGKPILFLSMFGKLDEKMPCANARTLRATLFKNEAFKKLVATDVIPAWEMVRAVPHIEIDMGDGKKITRTLRGNAVMYLCRPDGTVVDAFPGVYTAEDFLPMVRESMKLVAKSDAEMIAFHKKNGGYPMNPNITRGKMALESPTLSLLEAKPITGQLPTHRENESIERQNYINAALVLRDMSLTPATAPEATALLASTHPGGFQPADLGMQIVRSDSKANMQSTRPVVHLYFASLKKAPTPLEAREDILENILHIPYKDPYFGLKDVLLPGTPE